MLSTVYLSQEEHKETITSIIDSFAIQLLFQRDRTQGNGAFSYYTPGIKTHLTRQCNS